MPLNFHEFYFSKIIFLNRIFLAKRYFLIFQIQIATTQKRIVLVIYFNFSVEYGIIFNSIIYIYIPKNAYNLEAYITYRLNILFKIFLENNFEYFYYIIRKFLCKKR